MAQITRNLELDLCPNFTGPVFQAACNTIVATVPNKTVADIVKDFKIEWQTDCDAKKAAWDMQEAADQAARDVATQAATDEAACKQVELEAEIAAEKKEADKKKTEGE